MPSIFSDGMVLQRSMEVPVWGRGLPGVEVTVRLADQEHRTTTNDAGDWMVRLSPLEASDVPKSLLVQAGADSLTVNDILVGEVWLCSGQSNMEWGLKNSIDGDMAHLGQGDPLLRLYRVPNKTAAEPRFSDGSRWSDSSGETLREDDFSAVAWEFGKVLRETLGVPVGLIQAAWGGTPIIAWIRPSAFPRHPPLIKRNEEWLTNMPLYAEKLAAWEKDMAAWRKNHGLEEGAKVRPSDHPDAPKKPGHDPQSPNRPGALAQGMIAPLAPFALRGVIWYQGESDTGWFPERYHERLTVLFEDWREWFAQPDLAAGIVQLANFMKPTGEPSDENWPKVRESQRQFVLQDAKAGLAVTIDVGEANDIHPRDKIAVGRRLARWALADIYKKLGLRGGPELASVIAEEGALRLAFTQVSPGGLWIVNGAPLGGFTLAGEDGVFHRAEAEIIPPDTVIVRSQAVPNPKKVRYAWQNNPVEANLSNKDRLPASPFEAEVRPAAD